MITGSRLCAAMDELGRARADARVVAVHGQWLTGAELDRMARVHAARVLALGLAPGDRVALMAPTSLHGIAALIAHLRLGLVHVPLNTRYQPPEVRHVLQDSGARDLTELCTAAPTAGAPEPIDAWPSMPQSDALALVIYTSGTTGRAKGVMLSHRALADNLATMMDLWAVTARDVVSHALPLFHVHGLGLGLLGPLLVGARLRLHARFDASTVVADFAADASVFLGVPTMYHALMLHLASVPTDGAVLARGRLFTAGSAALPEALLQRFADATGHVILERYGMTETLFTLSNPLAGERRAGTVGRAVPGVQLRLVDDDGTPTAAGEPGEIEVRGPGLFDGYWGNPDASASAFRDGWFRTGDVATLDADGYFRIVGRRSTDIIKSGGFKIGAREIEDVLAQHPHVAEVAVLGLPDERWGELVAAAVVANASMPDGTDLAAELIAWCATRLADFKRPRRIVMLAALPRNAMGKVLKAELRYDVQGPA